MTAGLVIAKGHSSRLPGKNMKEFCGHPLTAWSIVQSVNAVLVDETYLSTDDQEIATMGEKYGAHIIWRDYVQESMEPANVPNCHALRKIKAERPDCDMMVNLLPTSPTRLPDDLDNMIMLKNKMGTKEMSCMTPHNEACESEIIGPNICKQVFWDKTGRYVTQGGGCSVYDYDYYLEFADIKEDFWTWEQMAELQKKGHAGARFFYREVPYYPLKTWQQFDIDYEDEFELLQILMEYYILKGRGIEIYEDYKRETERMDRRDKEPA